MLIGIGVGVLVVFFGVMSFIKPVDRVSERLTGKGNIANSGISSAEVRRTKGRKPTGIMKSVIPTDEKELTRIRRALQQAGFMGENSVQSYFLIRTVIGLLFPTLFFLTFVAVDFIDLPSDVRDLIPTLSQNTALVIVGALVVVGFYGPALIVKKRIESRRTSIIEGFPNALDLLQISVEAGLGFDAAMSRVGAEVSRSSPAISEEFQVAMMEISAGRDRDLALLAMADRTDVTEVKSFVSVILQSMEFGTSVSEALTTYAQDMRINRELRAQEKANKLPVQMSIILVLFMLPGLLAMVLSPVIVKYIQILAPTLNQQ